MGNLDVRIADFSFETKALPDCLSRVVKLRNTGFAGLPAVYDDEIFHSLIHLRSAVQQGYLVALLKVVQAPSK